MANWIQLCKSLDFKFLVLKLILLNSHHLEEIVSIAKEHGDADGYLAQANFKFAQLYGEMGNDTKSDHYMAAAEATWRKIS